MHILEINTEKTWRGGEKQTLLTCRGLARAEMHVDLLCLEGFPLADKARRAGITVHAQSGQPGAVRFLLAHGRNYDLIHVQTARAQNWAVLTKPVHGRPVVCTRRVDFVPRGRLTLAKYRATDRVVAISGAISAVLGRFGIPDVPVIPSCIDLERTPEPSVSWEELCTKHQVRGPKIIGTIAALVPHKDPLSMVRAVAHLSELRNDFTFVHFGDGELRETVEQEILRLGLDSIYRLTGFQDNAEALLPRFDLFAMSSCEEGLGSTVLEAFRHRIPVAATTAGGLAELVAGRGLNSPVGDPEQLAENMHRLLDDPDLAEALANRAHEYVLSEHSLKKMTRAYLELFSSMQG